MRRHKLPAHRPRIIIATVRLIGALWIAIQVGLRCWCNRHRMVLCFLQLLQATPANDARLPLDRIGRNRRLGLRTTLRGSIAANQPDKRNNTEHCGQYA